MERTVLQETRRSYPGIDLVRFVCALLVIAIHVYPFGNNGDPILSELNFLTQGWLSRLSVPFFFICTGFFLFRDTEGKTFPVDKVWGYEKKLLRLYLLWTLLYSPLILKEIILVHPEGAGAGVLRVIRDLFLTGSYHHLWYLHAALVAVAMVGLLRNRGVCFSKLLTLAGLLFLVGLLGQSYFGILMRLRERIPLLWKIWEVYEQTFITTRNGLFMGFLYVGIGAWFGNTAVRIPVKKAATGFVLSMTLMLVELQACRHLRFLLKTDMYVFQVPAAFFLFSMAMQLPLKEGTVWNHLRIVANISYFVHVWVYKLLGQLFAAVGVDVTVPCLYFLTSAAATLLVSEGIYRLQRTPKFAFLKKLYA